MVSDVPENKDEKKENQDKVDTNLSQQKHDTNLSQQQPENKENAQENPDWRAFREARKKDRAAREAAEKRAAEKEEEAAALKAAMEAAFSKNAPSPQAYNQYYNQGNEQEETEDERIAKKLDAMLAIREEKARKEWEERERQELPNRLKREFPDFFHVTAQEHIDYLDFHYPEVSRPLQRLQDGYEKWTDIYHAIKKFVPNLSQAKKDAVKADMNQQKPKSISSTGLTQTGENVRESWKEVEQRRAANWARKERIIKGI